MDAESKRSLVVFGGAVVAAVILGVIWWFSDTADPEQWIERNALWIVIVTVGGYLFVTMAIHLRRMIRDPQYCPRMLESYMGTGLMLAGFAERRRENGTQTCKTTAWLSFLFVPIVPLRSFEVRAPADWGWFSPKPFEVIRRIPLIRRHLIGAVVAWLVIGGLACLRWYAR